MPKSRKIPNPANRALALFSILLTAALCGSVSRGQQLPSEVPPDFRIEKGQNTHLPALQVALPAYVQVFGLFIHATPSGVDPDKLLHAAKIAADYLDNNRDGQVDNPEVNKMLWQQRAAIVMARDERAMEKLFNRHGEIFDTYRLQDLYASETHPLGAPHVSGSTQFDASLEEILHIITSAGYAAAYPQTFGELRGSQLANAMDAARGGYFRTPPRSYPPGAWYTYNDRTCTYACQITEYIYWALTSLLGAQDFPGRREEIENEWQLNTAATLLSRDRAVVQVLKNTDYNLPTRLPDGNYAINSVGTVISPTVSTDTGNLVFQFTIPFPVPEGNRYAVVASSSPGGPQQQLKQIITGDTLSVSGPAPIRQQIMPTLGIRVSIKDVQPMKESRQRFIWLKSISS